MCPSQDNHEFESHERIMSSLDVLKHIHIAGGDREGGVLDQRGWHKDK